MSRLTRIDGDPGKIGGYAFRAGMPVHVRQLNAYGGANLAPDAHDDGMRSSFSSQSPGWMAASFGGARMNMQDVTVHFRDFAACRGVVIDQLSALESIDLMAAFYREVRADDCDLDVDGDMLLFQWGVYDWGESKFFEYDITRQLSPGQPAMTRSRMVL